MPRVYFDNTFYNFLDKGWFTPEDVEEFKALSGRKIRGYFSPVNADELLGQWPTDRAAALRMLGIARDLVGFDHVLKQPSDLLRDEIVAYAQGLASPPKTMPPSLARFFDREMCEIAKGGPGSDQPVKPLSSLLQCHWPALSIRPRRLSSLTPTSGELHRPFALTPSGQLLIERTSSTDRPESGRTHDSSAA